MCVKRDMLALVFVGDSQAISGQNRSSREPIAFLLVAIGAAAFAWWSVTFGERDLAGARIVGAAIVALSGLSLFCKYMWEERPVRRWLLFARLQIDRAINRASLAASFLWLFYVVAEQPWANDGRNAFRAPTWEKPMALFAKFGAN